MKHFALCLLALLPVLCIAQPDTLWTRTYGGAGDDFGSGVILLPSGDCVLSATTDSYGTGGKDFYVVRITPSGDTVWTGAWGRGTGDDWCRGLVSRQNDAFHAFGFGQRVSGTEQAARDIYFDSTGHMNGYADWYSTGIDRYGYAICNNTLGRCLDVGSVELSSGRREIAYGETINDDHMNATSYWAERGYSSEARAVIATSDEGYTLAGWTKAASSGNADFLLLHLNLFGDTVWTHTYGGTGNDTAMALVQASDGGYVFTGYSSSYGEGGDMVLVKTDAFGTQQWVHHFGGTGSDEGHALLTTSDGGYLIVGVTTISGTDRDVFVVRTDNAGALLWSRTWGGGGADVANAVIQLSDNSYLVVGETNSFGAGYRDVWALRIASDLSADRPLTIIPQGFALEQNYPNPFNAATQIRFELPSMAHATVNIYDALGRPVARLFDKTATAGAYTIPLDASGWPSGVYFCRLTSGQTSLARKLTLVK